MIAADTCSLSAYFKGLPGEDTDKIDIALAANQLRLPPVVITELLSDPSPTHRADLEDVLTNIATLPLLDGYWQRAGHARRILKTKKLKAKIADALIAQSCIDHDVALITRDTDFRHFAKHCGLKLA
jgi:predicted nucleic acid-binding protein